MKNIFVHYGRISDTLMIKRARRKAIILEFTPNGGFWFDIYDGIQQKEHAHFYTVSSKARILNLDDVADLQLIKDKYLITFSSLEDTRVVDFHMLNFDAISKDYDIIYAENALKERAKHNPCYDFMEGWKMPILVLNKRGIKMISKKKATC